MEPIRIHPFDIANLLNSLPQTEFDAHIDERLADSAHLPGDGTIVIKGQVYILDTSVPYQHCPEEYERSCPKEFQNKAIQQ